MTDQAPATEADCICMMGPTVARACRVHHPEYAMTDQNPATEAGRAEIVPLTLAQARRYVADHHRHNEPPIGHRFSIGLERDGVLVGVVIAGRPIARGNDDGRTLELTRLTTEGDRNACSRLYGAACRAAFAMGYRLVITYTLAEEPGTSLYASGFMPVHRDGRDREWIHVGPRAADRLTLWDMPKMPTGPKVRWARVHPAFEPYHEVELDAHGEVVTTR